MTEFRLFRWSHDNAQFGDYGEGVPLVGGLTLSATIAYSRVLFCWTAAVCIHRPDTCGLREDLTTGSWSQTALKEECESVAARLLNHSKVQTWLASNDRG